MLPILGVVVVLVLVVAGVVIARRPDSFHVERSALVGAAPEAVFAIINDLSQWGRWSPYDRRDPNMKKTLEGPPSGPGASFTWNGNGQVGEGRLTIVDSTPGEHVTMKLEFTRPFKATNQVNFRLVPEAIGTRVSWIMDGKSTFVTKAMSLVIDMDRMMGADFEQGLANLDKVAQADAGSPH